VYKEKNERKYIIIYIFYGMPFQNTLYNEIISVNTKVL
jgi:hypothetical protein